jgi:hypothetical protein
MARRLPLDNPDHHKDLTFRGDWDKPFSFLDWFLKLAARTKYTGSADFLQKVPMALIGSGHPKGNLYKRLRKDYVEEVEKMNGGDKVKILQVRKSHCTSTLTGRQGRSTGSVSFLFNKSSPSPSCIGKNNYRSAE